MSSSVELPTLSVCGFTAQGLVGSLVYSVNVAPTMIISGVVSNISSDSSVTLMPGMNDRVVVFYCIPQYLLVNLAAELDYASLSRI